MNFHLKKAGYEKPVLNFSSDLKDGKAYAYLLNVLAPEHCSPSTADGLQMIFKPEDIVEGSPNLNLAFVAQIFHQRNGLTTDSKKISFAEMMTDDVQTSREERCFRLWISSLGIVTYVNNVFEDLRNGKVEKSNQVVRIGRQLKFSLVNVAGNDIVQGNKKLLLGKEITDADILKWAKNKIKQTGRTSKIENFKDKSFSSGILFLEILCVVEPRVVNWNLVTKGESDEEKRLNATYIISVTRKLGCSIFLLPEDIMEACMLQ
ncbi:hypothetical protein NC651_026902 [Populus alba x Populus x berolinensis]|nr:hypothetical protein NC651_026902 [Populus alba x Populus x berolinensis]